MQKMVTGFILVGLLGVGGWYLVSSNVTDKQMIEKEVADKDIMEEKIIMESQTMSDKESINNVDATTVKDEKEEMMEKEDHVMTDDVMMKKSGVYIPYDDNKITTVGIGDMVLFFKASWCPSCRALDTDIKNNLDNIPAGLTIFEVDYNTATELKKKYGVTTQHTLVQINNVGDQIKKWSGGSTLSSVVSQVE